LVAHRSAAVIAIASLLAVYIAFKWWERRRLYARMRDVRVTVDALRKLIESGDTPVIVDVRSHTARQLAPRQIVGAMHVIPGELDRNLAGIPHDRDIVLYCACPNEASAAQVADLLIKRGLKRVRPLLGGLDAWVAAGHPVEPVVVPNHAA
jgi:rhodanese-related sulfurtransferase